MMSFMFRSSCGIGLDLEIIPNYIICNIIEQAPLPVLLPHFLSDISCDHFLNKSLAWVPSSQSLLFERLN